jgi:chemotaxis protein methyltransferase CheR
MKQSRSATRDGLCRRPPVRASVEEPTLGAELFLRLSRFIESRIGIKMPQAKRVMVEARLRRRLRALAIDSYHDYVAYLFSPEGQREEVVHLLDAVTTNKTDFFREAVHFDLLREVFLPRLILEGRVAPRSPLRAWSAGCATGEEPYTLAMVLAEFARENPGFDFSILGSDVSSLALATAEQGVYDVDRVVPVPDPLRKRYLMRSKDPSRRLVRIVPELREKVRFRRINLMDAELGLRESFQVVFLRNVLIYFERPLQEELVRKVCGHLAVGGYLFVGHSETLMNMALPLVQMSQMVYQRIGETL